MRRPLSPRYFVGVEAAHLGDAALRVRRCVERLDRPRRLAAAARPRRASAAKNASRPTPSAEATPRPVMARGFTRASVDGARRDGRQDARASRSTVTAL